MKKSKRPISNKCRRCGCPDLVYRRSNERYASVCSICGQWQRWLSQQEIQQAKNNNELI